MDKWEKLYQFVSNLENDYYNMAFVGLKGGDRSKFLYFQSMASLCQKN